MLGILKYRVGDHVFLKSEERHQTKLDPKFKGQFFIVLDGDRYMLKPLTTKRLCKYPHDSVRSLPDEREICDLME